jgi:hypothetical protein
MGYHTGFQGEFQLEPPLNAAQVAYLQAFVRVRHGQRGIDQIKHLPDPHREAVGLEIGQEGLYCTSDQANNVDVYSDYNRAAIGAPDLYCPWTVSADGSKLRSSHPDKAHSPKEWLGFLLQHFLIPWHSQASGEVIWQGEDMGDTGAYLLTDNYLEVVTFRQLLENYTDGTH